MIVLCVHVYPDTPQFDIQYLIQYECYLSLHILVTEWLLAIILQIVQNLCFGKGFLYNSVVFIAAQCFRMKIDQDSGRYFKTEIQTEFSSCSFPGAGQVTTVGEKQSEAVLPLSTDLNTTNQEPCQYSYFCALSLLPHPSGKQNIC